MLVVEQLGDGMVEWFQFTLRAWHQSGDRNIAAKLLDGVTISPGDPAIVEGGPGVARVRLLSVSMADFAEVDTTEDAGAQSEAFVAAIREGLIRAGEWMSRQPVQLFEELRAAGCVTDVFVGGWMTDDQFDLDLPPQILRACGALGLTVSVCTND
jgi:hypothetical protein